MQSELEKEGLSLKMQTNVLNSRAMGFMVGAELIQEQRTLIQRLSAFNDRLLAALNEKENPKRDGGTVSAEAPKAS